MVDKLCNKYLDDDKYYIYVLNFVFIKAFLEIFYQNGKVGQLVYLIVILTSLFFIYSFLLFIKHRKELIEKKKNLFVLLFITYASLITLFYHSSVAFESLYTILYSYNQILLWPIIFLDLNITSSQFDFEKIKVNFKFWAFVMLIPFVLLAINSRPNYVGSAYFIYYTIFMIPMLYVFFDKKMSYLLSLVYIFLLLFVGKRGGILALAIGVFCYLIYSYICSQEKKKYRNRILTTLGILVIIALISSFFVDITSIRFISRFLNLGEDGGSGRTRLWSLCISQIKNMSFVKVFFGYGFRSVYELLGKTFAAAHNDILEIFIDYGLIGFSLFIMINLRWILIIKKVVLNKTKYAGIIMSEFIMYFILGEISFMFWFSEVMIMFILLFEILINLNGIEQRKDKVTEN
jgi:O-antigen ligase